MQGLQIAPVSCVGRESPARYQKQKVNELGCEHVFPFVFNRYGLNRLLKRARQIPGGYRRGSFASGLPHSRERTLSSEAGHDLRDGLNILESSLEVHDANTQRIA